MEYRNIPYRLHPKTQAKHKKLSAAAGACRYVWNHFLRENKAQMEMHKVLGTPKPSISFMSQGKEFTKLRHKTPWLSELPASPVRYVLKYQENAWKKAFKSDGFPKFKGRYGDDSITFPEGTFRIEGDYVHLQKIGYVLLSRCGGNPYPDGHPKSMVVKRVDGDWIATVCYAVSDQHKEDNGHILGVDMNVGQVTTSDRETYYVPQIRTLEAKKKRYQRMMSRRKKGSNRRAVARHRLAKTNRNMANVRSNWHHQTSRILADTAGFVVLEELKVQPMLEGKGKRLNRTARETGWSGLRDKIEYKAHSTLSVNPAYTSQMCYECGHTERKNRKTQSEFECVSCGHKVNADYNAALNIRALGIGASGRGEAFSLETSMIRQNVALLEAA